MQGGGMRRARYKKKHVGNEIDKHWNKNSPCTITFAGSGLKLILVSVKMESRNLLDT